MKILNRATRLIAMLLVVPALVSLWFAWNAGPTRAANGGVWTTGMFALAHHQTARINATCLSPDPCLVELLFVDSMGNAVSEFAHKGEVRSGKTVSVDYMFELPESHRVELRAVGIIGSGADESEGKDVLFTGEVFDNNTGRTTFTQTLEECRCTGR